MSVLLVVAATAGRGQTMIDLRTQGRNVDFSAASSTKPSKTGTALPAACAVGETFFKTDAPPGKNQYGCTSPNTWSLQGGDELPERSGKSNWILTNDGANAEWRALGGDLAGRPEALLVQGLQGQKVAPAVPHDGNVLQWNSSSNQWEPSAGGTGAPNYSAVFTSATTVTIAGSAHGFSTTSLIVACYDDSMPPRTVEADQISIDPASRDVLVTFSRPQTGYCVVNGAAGSSGLGGGAFYVLDGDAAGDPGDVTVTRIQNRPVSAVQPANGQALMWNAVDGEWQPQTVASGGGLSMSSELGDLSVVRTSATTLSIGAGCSAATPCNVRLGDTVYSIQNGATATLTAGNGIAYIYVASGGVLTLGLNAAVACSTGCVVNRAVTAFPPDSIPLFTWTVVDGLWEPSGGRDQRAWLNTKVLNSGMGIQITQAGEQTFVGVDTASVPSYLSGAATADFPEIPSGACASDRTFTLTGAAVGDAIAPGWPAGLEAGLFGTMRVSAADTIAIRLCNLSGAAIDPANATFRATIVRSF